MLGCSPVTTASWAAAQCPEPTVSVKESKGENIIYFKKKIATF